MQADLGPAPQNIVGAARPLVGDQVVDLGLRQSAAVVLAQIQHGLRFAENLLDARAIRARESMSRRRRQEAPALLHAGKKRREVRARQITAGQRGLVGPFVGR